MDRTRILIVASLVVVGTLVGIFYYSQSASFETGLFAVFIALLIVFVLISGYLVQTSRLAAGAETTEHIPRPLPESEFDPWMKEWRRVTQSLPQVYPFNLLWFFGNGLIFVFLGALSLYNVLNPQPFMVMPAIWAITLGLFLAALYFFLRLLLLVDSKVVLSSTAVQYTSSRGSWQVGWDDVERVREKWITSNVPFRNIHHLYLTARDGRQLRLDQSLQNMDDLAKTFRAVWATKKMPGALKALERGEILDFHPFTLSNQGIGYKGKLLPVRDAETETYAGFFRLKSQRKYWASEKAANVTNLALLLRLLHYLRKT